jgi:hypothetical protein
VGAGQLPTNLLTGESKGSPDLEKLPLVRCDGWPPQANEGQQALNLYSCEQSPGFDVLSSHVETVRRFFLP